MSIVTQTNLFSEEENLGELEKLAQMVSVLPAEKLLKNQMKNEKMVEMIILWSVCDDYSLRNLFFNIQQLKVYYVNVVEIVN